MDGKLEGHTKYIENATHFALSASIMLENLRGKPVLR